MNRSIAAFTQSPRDVHLDGQGRPLVLKPRPRDTYRASRRNKAKVKRRTEKDQKVREQRS